LKKVYAQTFGCQMNVADSAEMMLHLTARGCSPAASLKEADIVLINTCTIRDHAEHKALSFLGRLQAWKAEKAGRKIIFAGCAAQRLGRGVRRRFPQVDIVAGAKEIDAFADIIDSSRLFDAPLQEGAAPGAADDVVGLVNIMRGCSCKCSYCIVPYVRGDAYSLDPDTIFEAARRKVNAGAKEIVLLGQTVNGYGYKSKNFSKLLRDLVKIEGLKRIRCMSPHPVFIDKEFIETVSQNPKISRHLHLPVQSGSTKILADMKRGYTRELFVEKVAMLASAGVEVSTDIIVGYPTEAQKDFEDTLSLVDEISFTGAYCFKFSPRAGTPAALLPEIPEKEVEKRLDILLNKIKQSSAAAYKRQLGTMQEVLFETPVNGRTLSNFWVRTEDKHQKGEIVEVKIKEVKDTILLA
jgi:tRNA-2-methylthio-N6-dimethylallyladenosine synthase